MHKMVTRGNDKKTPAKGKGKVAAKIKTKNSKQQPSVPPATMTLKMPPALQEATASPMVTDNSPKKPPALQEATTTTASYIVGNHYRLWAGDIIDYQDPEGSGVVTSNVTITEVHCIANVEHPQLVPVLGLGQFDRCMLRGETYIRLTQKWTENGMVPINQKDFHMLVDYEPEKQVFILDTSRNKDVDAAYHSGNLIGEFYNKTSEALDKEAEDFLRSNLRGGADHDNRSNAIASRMVLIPASNDPPLSLFERNIARGVDYFVANRHGIIKDGSVHVYVCRCPSCVLGGIFSAFYQTFKKKTFKDVVDPERQLIMDEHDQFVSVDDYLPAGRGGKNQRSRIRTHLKKTDVRFASFEVPKSAMARNDNRIITIADLRLEEPEDTDGEDTMPRGNSKVGTSITTQIYMAMQNLREIKDNLELFKDDDDVVDTFSKLQRNQLMELKELGNLKDDDASPDSNI